MPQDCGVFSASNSQMRVKEDTGELRLMGQGILGALMGRGSKTRC